MAAQPMLADLSARINARGAQEGITGEEYIFMQVVEGKAIRAIMEEFGVSRGMFYSWLKDGGTERRMDYESAKKLSAEHFDEEEDSVIDEMVRLGPTLTRGDVAARKLKAEKLRHKASIRDRDQFGKPEAAAVNIQLGFGDAYLQELRQLGKMGQPQQEIEDAEYDLLPEGEDTESNDPEDS